MLMAVERERFETLSKLAPENASKQAGEVGKIETVTLEEYLASFKKKAESLSTEELKNVVKESIKETAQLKQDVENSSRKEAGRDAIPQKDFLKQAIEAALKIQALGDSLVELPRGMTAALSQPNVPTGSIEIPVELGARQ